MVHSSLFRTLLGALFVAATSAAHLAAQESAPLWFVGGTAGIAWSSHAGSMTLGGADLGFCRSVDDATGSALFVGGVGGLLLKGGVVEFAARAGYMTLDGAAYAVTADQLILLPGRDEPVDQTIVQEDTVEYRLLQLELLAGLRAAGVGPLTLLLSAGPSIGHVTGASFTRRARLRNPSEGRIVLPTGEADLSPDGRTVTFLDRSEIDGLSRFRLGLKGGLAVVARVGSFEIVPGIYYDHALTRGSSTYDWRVDALTAQVDVRLRLD